MNENKTTKDKFSVMKSSLIGRFCFCYANAKGSLQLKGIEKRNAKICEGPEAML